MDNHDGLIKRDDVKAFRREVGEAGWGDEALSIFEREPLLGKCIAHRWSQIHLRMMALGLTDKQVQPILREIVQLVVEPLGLQERAKRKLMADFLPNIDNEGGGE
jgi:hypothetical protein